MKNKKVSSAFVSTLAFFLLCLLFCISSRIEARSKNYYFPEIRVEINIDKDGSFTVDEYRTFEFEGSFSWASLWVPLFIDLQGDRYDLTIEDFKILDEQGRPLKTEISGDGEKLEAKWYFRARDGRRTFHFHYRIQGAIISYSDVSEICWQVIGDDWEKPTGQVTVNVHLPQPVSMDNIYVWGHGPLSGMCEIVDQKTGRFVASNLPAWQYMEIRMVWPAGVVSGVPSNSHTLQSIKDQEERMVQVTIERAKIAYEEAEKKRKNLLRLVFIWAACLITVPAIWLFFYFRFWKRVGQDYRFEDIPEYYRELPSKLSPALVEVLVREGREITTRSFTATIFDLARRGYIEIDDQPVEGKGFFRRREDYQTVMTCRKDFQSDWELLSYEEELLRMLFAAIARQGGRKGAQLTLDKLKSYLKKNPQKFQEWYKKWKTMIQKESENLQFIEPESTKMRNIFVAVTVPLAILTLNPVLIILSGILIPKIKRRAKRWARENEFWKALDRFLDDFSSFKETPPEAYKLWEYYLVFAIIFGNAKKILKMLPVILKDERAIAPVWYYGFNRAGFINTGRLASMIKSIHVMSTSIQQASTSAAHYSSGRGGGFSGGRVGGVGGGGGRAG